MVFGGCERSTTNPVVEMKTSMGTIVIELYADRAPVTVENFLAYVDAGYYEGLIFHRVMSDFMIQGGGFTRDLQPSPTRPPIRNEADSGLKNLKGTIAMARTDDPHSASAQFFINVEPNPALDHRDRAREGWGYAVFGRVIEGMEVVERIRRVPVRSAGPRFGHLPVTPVVIESVTRRDRPA